MDREDCICHKISIPRIDKPVNTIGSGDTCSAVTLSEIVCGTNPLDAFRYGLAAATANCLNEVPGMFIREKALELFSLTHYCKEKI